MQQNTSALLNELDRLLRRLSEIVRRDFLVLSNAQLHWKPDPMRWSIAECLQHLHLVGNAYLPLLEEALNKNKNKISANTFRRGFLGHYFVKRVQLREDNSAWPLLKTARLFHPSKKMDQDGNELVRQFLAQNARFVQLIQAAYQVNLEQVRVSIPLLPFIRLRLGDMLQFLIFHIERHVVQAQKVYSEEQFP